VENFGYRPGIALASGYGAAYDLFGTSALLVKRKNALEGCVAGTSREGVGRVWARPTHAAVL
jgi:hypothetical protein